MFSISELACASRSGNVLIKIVWLGISCAACFNSASAARAAMQCLKMALVSKSALGGNNGKLLNGLSGCQMDMRLFFFLAEGMAARYVDAIDTSTERVEKKG
jgi:hypothetical protein